MRRVLTSNQQANMVRPVSMEEIKKAMFSIDSGKAPGPDGYNAVFFKQNWEIVGAEVTEAVHSFFTNNQLLKAWNATVVSLIPKTVVPQTMRDFRPISSCNVVYKCISKILVNRIRPMLNHLVGSQQSAFVTDRHIADNILLMQELMRGYHRDNGVPRCALKVDIQNAYVLMAMGFPIQMVKWLMVCVSSPT